MRKARISLILVFFLALSLCVYINASSQESDLTPVYLRVSSVVASSFDDTPDWAPPPNPQATIDGDLLTRWSSRYIDNQWITFDFGKAKVVDKAIIFWEAAYAVDYDILASSDNQNWQTIQSLKDQKGNINTIEFTPFTARYVRILCLKRFNPEWGISIWEALFFGPADKNPEDKPLIEVYPQIVNKLTRKETIEKDEEIEKPVASPGSLALTELQKGVVYTSWSREELGAPVSDKTLQHLYNLGVRHLGLMVVWFQDDIDSKNIYPDTKDTPDDRALIHAINKAHSLGMKVMFKPHVDVKTGQWRGDIIASLEWFASYKKFVLYYAKLATQYNVEAFSIGTELANTTTPNWQKEWEEVIAQTRSVFPGNLTYSANWNEYLDVGFWDKLDYIGIDAYFPLTAKKDPKKEELIVAWQANAKNINHWLKDKKLDKPVVFTEVGYCSADGTNMQPWSVLSNLSKDFIDQQEQADALEVMLAVCATYPWFKGFYWWNYFPQERWSPLGYTIIGKKAEEVFSYWLKKL